MPYIADWDVFFMGMAQYVSQKSKDPSTQVGAVLVSPDRKLVIPGWNGFPTRIGDTAERLHNRDLKYQIVLHAEENALGNCPVPPKGFTLYVWPLAPCAKCAAHIIQRGVDRVVFPHDAVAKAEGRWKASNQLALDLLSEAGVRYEYHGDEGEIPF